jgi:diguanylate cyclase (GGDEF)-like protein
LVVEAFFLAEAGDAAGELSAMQGTIRHARRAGSRQDEVLGLANLADHYLRRGDFTTALALSREALPLTRAAGDRIGESVALANIGLALISLRQPAEGLRFTRQSMALDERVGAVSSMASLELEVGSYLERAGYLREAVAAFQRQRKLADEVSRRDHQQAILELQESQDHERRLRELELLQRENDLQQARLLNQTLTQRLWAAAALAALLLLAVAVLVLHRLRRHNAALKEGNALLRTLSEHDALTGLANRHHLYRLRHTAPDGATAPFEGSLLLIDIDHFKRINDHHGHAAGDAVLVETARRLRGVLRDGDLIVRWGGEEFLVVAHALSQAQLEALAQRLLGVVADRPVALDGQTVAVTASIGYASFPTQPTGLAVTWERALALVDTALYLAKAHGRNLAYGVWQLHAQDEHELMQISHGLEAAWREGRVQLTASHGPEVAVSPAPSPDLTAREINA